MNLLIWNLFSNIYIVLIVNELWTISIVRDREYGQDYNVDGLKEFYKKNNIIPLSIIFK